MTQREEQFVGPYRLERTLGKGQTGMLTFIMLLMLIGFLFHS